MEVCGYCGEQRGEKMGCCGENHWDEVDDDPRPCECRQGECESKSDKVCRMSEEVGRQRGCKVSEFKREPRYVVFKIKDIERYVTSEDKLLINEVGAAIAVGRNSDGKPPFNAVVVEQDWPEFEMVWAAIEARMTTKFDRGGQRNENNEGDPL